MIVGDLFTYGKISELEDVARVWFKVFPNDLGKVGKPTLDPDKASAHPQLHVSFPPITTKTSPTRAFDFSVKCEHLTDNVVTCEKECRVYSPNFCSAESRDTAPCACNFNYAALRERFRRCFTRMRKGASFRRAD